MIEEYCKTSADVSDYFVGIRFHEDKPEVVFPHGFNISKDDKECRKDIFCLLNVLKKFSNKHEGNSNTDDDGNIKTFPLSSYQYIINDFLSNGYYTEREIQYIRSKKGVINWKRTIQKEQAYIDNANIVYLDYQVKTNRINENSLITVIHKYCVYQSFLRFGWLYFPNNYLPQKPVVKVDIKHFISITRKALNDTFNDKKRLLFQNMLNILYDNEEEISIKNYCLGVNKFENVWENLIDFIFGEENKKKYYPYSTWHINGDDKKNSHLSQDTIMKRPGKIYVLDAKYYHYCIRRDANDLPQTDSIQKQLTYGKNIVNMGEVNDSAVFNAFVMPYCAGSGEKNKECIGVSTADWEEYNNSTLNYAYVLGILIDTKSLISDYTRHNEKEIMDMADIIEESLRAYRARSENGQHA